MLKKVIAGVVAVLVLGVAGYFIKMKLCKECILLVADFNTATAENLANNVGGNFGSWDKDPNDKTQWCRLTFVSPGHDGKGKCAKLSYDVDSPNPAYNGFYVQLAGSDTSAYKRLSFMLRGDKKGYPGTFKLELKSETKADSIFIENITEKWQEIEVPLAQFSLIKDYSKMKEFVIVFEDSQTRPREGAIYVDDIAFKK